MIKKEIEKFKKKYRKELQNCENHNLIEFLMCEPQKVWGWRFEKNFFNSISRIQQIERIILPEVVEIYRKYGLEIALQQFENLFSNLYRKDRR